MRTLEPRELEIGMMTAAPVQTPIGQILAPANTLVTRQLINRMKLYRVEEVSVYEEESKPVTKTAQEPETPKPGEQPTQPKPHAESISHSVKVAVSPEFRDFHFAFFACIQKMKDAFTAAADHNEPIDTGDLLTSVSELFRSRNTIIELFDMLYNMRTITDSVYAHCLNVSLISRMIGRWLKLQPHDLDVMTIS